MTNFSGNPIPSTKGNAACGGPQGGGRDSRRTNYPAVGEQDRVPAGYKQTEVGVIPEDWEAVKLGDVADVKMCKRILSHQTVKCGGIPFFKIGTFGGEPDAYIPGSLYQDYRAKFSFPEAGDVLISAAGTLGKKVIYNGSNAYFQDSNIVWLSLDKKKVKNEYLYQYYNVIKWASSEGSTISRLYNGIIKSSFVALPTIEEQTAIANALSDVDALISELEKLIAKKQAIKTASMQQLLTGRTRLPQFAHHPDGSPKGYKSSELGDIPEDWEVVRVGDRCDLLTGYPFPSKSYTDSGIRLLRGSNVKRGRTDWSEEITQYWPEITSTIAQYELKDGDIVISMDGSLVGRSFAQLSKSDLPAVLLQRVARLRGLNVSQSYLREWVCSKFFTEHCDSVKTVTAIPHISPQDIRSFKFFCPQSEQEQTAIATILSDMDSEIQALEQRLAKTRQLKQGMMQELLTGKTRLVKAQATGVANAR
ncbi:MAG: restriction endonuclease subunit S [Cellvibrio sp.]